MGFLNHPRSDDLTQDTSKYRVMIGRAPSVEIDAQMEAYLARSYNCQRRVVKRSRNRRPSARAEKVSMEGGTVEVIPLLRQSPAAVASAGLSPCLPSFLPASRD